MKHFLLAVILLGIGAGIACAEQSDLGHGVFIVHSDPAIIWSDSPPARDWCLDAPVITSCDQQNPSVSAGGPVVWYVLAHWWDEPKMWCLTQFGFGNYDVRLFAVLESGPCSPGGNLEIPTGAWPGPNSGTAVATTDLPWLGNFVPVYYFAGYGYGSGQIPLAPDPTAHPFAGFANCNTPVIEFDAACLPALGIDTAGEECCSVEPFPCCVDELCRMMTPETCSDIGGVLHPEFVDCGPPDPCVIRACCVGIECFDGYNWQQCVQNGGVFQPGLPFCEPTTCLPTAACCIGEVCRVISEMECTELGGEYFPETEDCGPPNPCVGACCVGGICSVTTEQDCADFGGVYFADLRDCDPDPCVIRACCIGLDCVDGYTWPQCVENGGVSQPDLPACEETTCLPTAACCVGNVCSVTTDEICSMMGGVYFPVYVDCHPDPCNPTPACCVRDVCTITTTLQGCLDIGGRLLPGVTDCEPNPCGSTPTQNMSWGKIKTIYR